MGMTPRAGLLRTDETKWKDKFVTYYEVEHSGMLNFTELYTYMHEWFGEQELESWQSETDHIEDFYLQKIRPDGVQENVIWWRGKKDVTPYFTYFCKLDWSNFGSTKTEILYGDKKVKVDKIGVVLRAWWWLQIDPENRWEKSMLSRLTEYFYNYLISGDVETHVEKIRSLARKQEDAIKQFMQLPTYQPHERTFFPEGGYKWDRPKVKPEHVAHAPRRGDTPIT